MLTYLLMSMSIPALKETVNLSSYMPLRSEGTSTLWEPSLLRRYDFLSFMGEEAVQNLCVIIHFAFIICHRAVYGNVQ